MSQQIVVVNESTVLTDKEVQQAAEALQIQLSRDFCPIWGGSYTVVFQAKTAPVPPSSWLIGVFDTSDQAGALGYHDLTAAGRPLSKVFAKDCMDDGVSWTVDFTHEGLEMPGDPYINECVQNGNRIFAKEVCDGPEDDSFGYKIALPDGTEILVTDFVTPQWFVEGEPGPYDFKGHMTAPLQILMNGYIGVMDLSRRDNWQQLLGSMANEKAARRAAPRPGHRRYLRTVGRENLKRSTAH